MIERVKSKAREKKVDKQKAGDERSLLDESLMETFPASDPMALTQPGQPGAPDDKAATARRKTKAIGQNAAQGSGR